MGYCVVNLCVYYILGIYGNGEFLQSNARDFTTSINGILWQ